jgi:hypothetical protein
MSRFIPAIIKTEIREFNVCGGKDEALKMFNQNLFDV